MLIRSKRGWELPESLATPEDVFLRRREFGKIAAAHLVVLDAPPESWLEIWPSSHGVLPDGVRIVAGGRRRNVDIVLAFFVETARLKKRFDALKGRIIQDGALWVAWPKRASNVPTDLSENVVREIALTGGLVDVKVCAIDEVWSGLKLVYRLKDRK